MAKKEPLITRVFPLILLWFCVYAHATAQDYRQVDRIVAGWPSSFSSPEKLATIIRANFNRPEERARAAYAWIARHIDYDIKALNKPVKVVSYSYSTEEEKLQKEKEVQRELALRTLRRHKAVCHGYATLFKQVCEQMDIECVTISGTAKIYESDIGRMPGNPNHAWNAIRINGQWKLVDATWGAGYINGNPPKFYEDYDDIYFFTPPEKFFLNHYPSDPKWLFVKMTPEAFAWLPLYYPEALKSGIRVVKPSSGFIKVSGKKPIQLVLENYQNGTINFSLNGRNYPEALKPVRKGNHAIFNLPVNRPGTLTVFLDGKAFVGFKLIR